MQYLSLIVLVTLILEILSIILVASWLGFFATFGLILLSFFTGLFVMKRNAGFAKVLMASELLRAQNQGSVSFYQMMWPIRIPVAGFLLMLPGFLSSLGALGLLLPIKGKPIETTHFGNKPFQAASQTQDGDIIDAEFVVRHGTKPAGQRKQLEIIEHEKNT